MHGLSLLTASNPKTRKGEKLGYLTGILHLAPNTLSGFNVCPKASKGCIAGCLNTAGRGAMGKIQRARIRKTLQFFNERESFMSDLFADIYRLQSHAKRLGLIPCVRLNGTSDIRWETIPVNGFPNIMLAFPQVQFYDYTKILNRRNIPTNYKLTFSRSESNDKDVKKALENGYNVAVVFRGKVLPKVWNGHKVIDGTESDVRFNDPSNVIVGLTAKGRARRDLSGFVIDV